MMRFFLRLDLCGIKHLKTLKDRPVILASNHPHEFDPAFVPSAIPQTILHSPVFFVSLVREYYTSKKFGWRRYIYGGIFFTMFGAYPAYKGVGNYERALEHHIQILNDGGTVYIFPQGKLSGNLNEPAKGGVGYLSWKTNTPVVPILIEGVENMSLKEFLLRKRRIRIIIGRPLTKLDLGLQKNIPSPDEYKSAAEKIMNIITSLKNK